MKRQKKILAFVISLVFLTIFPIAANAEDFINQGDGIDVIFVMDYSGSMKTNDSQNIAKGMVKAFIDTVYDGDIRVGFVAYNDQILSSTSPMSINTYEDRNALKNLVDAKGYSGNTDIGLGLRYAYDLLSQESGRKKILVLISDGESDLGGSVTGRDLEMSEDDLAFATEACHNGDIPVYTIAFGKFDGSMQVLETISQRTGAQTYKVENPEKLIEILYGIFKTNMHYTIKKITDGIYASGIQNIHIMLDEPYLDEMDLLMISPQAIGTSRVLYGEQVIEPVNLEKYAVAKITDIDNSAKELIVQTETLKNQQLQVYLVSYRTLIPVIEVDTNINKNQKLLFRVYFRNNDGTPVLDEGFYEKFDCQVRIGTDEQGDGPEVVSRAGTNGITGELYVTETGSYYLNVLLRDAMGTEVFQPVVITAENRLPEGELPEIEKCTIFTKTQEYRLADYFFDPDGDELSYFVSNSTSQGVKASIMDGILFIKAAEAGTQEIHLSVSDGEESIIYKLRMDVVPLWKAYWWIIAICVVLFLAVIIKRFFPKPRPEQKPELESLVEEKAESRFAGKMDAYVTSQPEGEKEIPPLSFDMYKIKGNKITLGKLLSQYSKLCDELGLDDIYLIADKNRQMILYHTSGSSVMIGNSIVCRQAQYSVSFGDVIYITSLDGFYDLEIHYIAVFQ